MKLKLLSLLALASFVNAETVQFTEYLSVRSCTPEYQIVQVREPYQECYDERIPLSNGSNNIGGSILGGIVGGVIGHQIGEGKGNDIATVGGAILGTIVGQNSLDENHRYTKPQYKRGRNCITKYHESRRKRQFIGYKNIAYYKGKKIVKYTNEKLSSIPITVTIDY